MMERRKVVFLSVSLAVLALMVGAVAIVALLNGNVLIINEENIFEEIE